MPRITREAVGISGTPLRCRVPLGCARDRGKRPVLPTVGFAHRSLQTRMRSLHQSLDLRRLLHVGLDGMRCAQYFLNLTTYSWRGAEMADGSDVSSLQYPRSTRYVASH